MATRSREKAKARKESADKRPAAKAKYIRMSPSKVRRIIDIIKGKKYNEAVAILENTPNAACEVLLKLVNSAAANAEHNLGMAKSDLFVAEAFADQGPTLKRIQPVSKGRAHSILKRTSHITVILDAAVK